MGRELKVGQHVIYTDSRGVKHDAVVTAWWASGLYDEATGRCPQLGTLEEFRKLHGENAYPGLNLVIVTGDEKKTDEYGRQIERFTSVCHRTSMPGCHGNLYEFPDECE